MSAHSLIRPVRRPLFLWLALFAVLLNALAPSVSHAVAARHPAIPVDVCSVDGGHALAAAASLINQQERQGAHPMDDCGYCLTHAGSHALPPPPAAVPPMADAAAERPYLSCHAPRPLLVLAAAPPRGPPAFA